NTTGKAQEHIVAAHLCAHLLDQIVDNIRWCPECLAAADIQQEARQNAPALAGVGHFRVELHTIVAARVIAHRSDGAARRAGENMETRRHVRDLVTVAHPHVEAEHAVVVHVVFDTVEQLRLTHEVDTGITEFTYIGTLNLAAKLLGHGLHAVANTEQRYAQIEYRLWRARAVRRMYRLGATSKDDPARVELTNILIAHVKWVQFAVHPELTHAAGDQLGVLRAEIENQDAVRMDIGMCHFFFTWING